MIINGSESYNCANRKGDYKPYVSARHRNSQQLYKADNVHAKLEFFSHPFSNPHIPRMEGKVVIVTGARYVS